MATWLKQQRVALREIRPEILLQTYMLMVALSFGLGGVIIAGGEQRFSGPSFKGARDLVSWAGDPHLLWGAMFILLGALLVWGVGKRMAIHFLRFGLVVFVFLALSFVRSISVSPAVALTGIVAYAIFGALHLALSLHLDKHGWN